MVFNQGHKRGRLRYPDSGSESGMTEMRMYPNQRHFADASKK